ncbi:ATP-binding protein [Halobacillus shinanisalinarum]|uniref:histidine kinase n=1 Tax=Halobacillus shinanisalinarum TaxID=2932258 RepID=A0ABY4GWZ9_9BACI|nr:PAS domain-containing sensor histidine kinase [Halobacillus shinanisalinarum]UOQ92536.1 ATP-binding protein [Halobacillus shinanisalinarum]
MVTRERYSDHVHCGEMLDILEASGTPACLINVHYQTVALNDEMRKALQLDQTHFSLCEWFSLFRSSNRPDIHQMIYQSSQTKELDFSVDMRVANEYRIFLCKIFDLKNDQKTLIFPKAHKVDSSLLQGNEELLQKDTDGPANMIEHPSNAAFRQTAILTDQLSASQISPEKELFSQVADHFPHGLAMVNNSWELIYANDKMEKLTGLSYQTNLNRKLWDVVSVDEYSDFFRHCLRAMDTQESVELEGELNKYDLTVKMTILPTTQGLTIIGQDITLYKQQLSALQASEKRFSMLANNINDVFWICDSEFQKIHYVSPAFNDMFGMRRREILASWSSLENIVHMNDYNRVLNAFSVMKQQKHQVDYRVTTTSGEEKWIRTKGFPIISEGTEYIIGTHQDITKYKEMVQLKEKSQQLSTITQMAAGVAHEIKNPLTAIKGFLQIGAVNPDLRDNYYEIILDEVNRIESIVQDFMMLSKPKSSIQLEKIDIEEVVSYVLRLLDPEATGKNVDLSFTCDIVEKSFQSEPKRLKQILLNLASNAIDATEEEGDIRVAAYNRGDDLVLSVKDDGQGLSDQQLAKLGEPFFTTKEKGTGLGVMVTKKMVTDLNGTIAYKSELGKGTCVTVCLPYEL